MVAFKQVDLPKELHHLGAQSSTVDQSYVAKLTESEMHGKQGQGGSQPVEVSQGSNQPPPGPPGPGATPIMVGVSKGKAIKMVPVRKTAKRLRTQGRAATRTIRDDMIIDPTKGPPGPEPVPAGMAPPHTNNNLRLKLQYQYFHLL